MARLTNIDRKDVQICLLINTDFENVITVQNSSFLFTLSHSSQNGATDEL